MEKIGRPWLGPPYRISSEERCELCNTDKEVYQRHPYVALTDPFYDEFMIACDECFDRVWGGAE